MCEYCLPDDAPEGGVNVLKVTKQLENSNLSEEDYSEDDDDYSDYEERDDVRKQCFGQSNRQVHFQDQQKV